MYKVFVYSMREFDELPFYKKYAKEMGIEFDYTTEYPCPENYHYARGYDGLSIITTPTPAEMVDAMKDNGIKVISTRTIGYDHVDTDRIKELGMGLTNVTYSPASVADYTIMLMLMACRKLKYIMDKAAVQDYRLATAKLGKEISKCTVGIVGTGRIGRTVIEHLSGFGCRMLAYDIFENDTVKQYAEYTDLETIYRECDIITLHAPATDDTYHMLDAEAFNKMKDDVIIVNCARGQLIDTHALIDALRSGKVGYACLDVIEKELGIYYNDFSGRYLDNPEMHILRSMPNVVFSPHTAFYTDEAVGNMVEHSLMGIKAYLDGEDHPFIVKL